MTFRVFGIKVKVSFLFVALVTTFMVIDSSKYMLLGLSSALIHEMGHIIAMILVGSKPAKIEFNLFDIDIKDNNRNNRNYKNDVFTLLGGSIANFLTALFLWILYYIFKDQSILMLISENLILGFFNILPIESLDGGQILYIFLSNKMQNDKAIVFLEVISFIILLPLAVIGFYMLLKSKYNFSLLLISCYLISAILIKKGHIF